MRSVFRGISSVWRAHKLVLQRTAVLTVSSGICWHCWNSRWRFSQPGFRNFTVYASSRDHPINITAEIVEKAGPAVVSILCEQNVFGIRQAVANGSGFIVRSDGLILTNAHVVARARTVRVRLPDGREFDGIVHAIDPVSDLATVKISKVSNLPVLTLGDSDALRAGEWVAAIGSPLSLQNTVTAGIISTVHRPSDDLGLGRRGREYGHGMSYIQTDATITFGNSGGPLVNVDGIAIGINTMKIEAGISFAIPSNHARRFLEKVEAASRGDKVVESTLTRRRYLGIEMLSLTAEIMQELRSRVPNFPNVSRGVYVHRVAPGSPAAQGGLQPGDVIVEINKKAISSASDVYSVLNDPSFGELLVAIVRRNEVLTVRVVPDSATEQ